MGLVSLRPLDRPEAESLPAYRLDSGAFTMIVFPVG